MLSEKIRELFGFDFSDLLKDIAGAKKSSGKKGLVKRRTPKAGAKKQVRKKKSG